MTKWTDHVKAFAKRQNISYGCAMSMPECSASYQSTKAPKAPKAKAKAETKFTPLEEARPELVSKNITIKPRPQEEMKEMPYQPKMTREMRFQMEKALREGTKHLPPLRTKREDELIAQQVPALKGILRGLKEKTTGLKRQDMIDLILKREGLVKGAVFDDMGYYKDLVEQYKIRENNRFLLDGATLKGMREHVAGLRDELKEAKQSGDRRKVSNLKTLIDRYSEEVSVLERTSKRDQYIISKLKK